MRMMKVLAALVLTTSLATCFTVDHPVLGPADAEAVSWLPGTYAPAEGAEGETAEILPPENGNDYIMLIADDAGVIQRIILRVMRFDDGIGLVQASDGSGGEPEVFLALASRGEDGILVHVPGDDVDPLLQAHGLKLESFSLIGEDAAILQFMQALSKAPMDSEYILLRVE